MNMKKIILIVITLSSLSYSYKLSDILGLEYMEKKRSQLTNKYVPKYKIDAILIQEAQAITKKVKAALGEDRYKELQKGGATFSELYWISTLKDSNQTS